MKKHKILPIVSLQHFAEGGAAAGGTGTAAGTGVTGNDAGSQNPGVKTTTDAPAAGAQQVAAQAPDRKAEFDKLIKGDYKDLYEANVQNIIQSRLKANQKTVDSYKALQPFLDLIGAKYGISDVTDVQGLIKAIEDDDTFFEEEANRRGMTVEQYKGVLKMQRENADLRRQMQEQQAQAQEKQRQEAADRIYAEWMQQAEELKTVYPGFDFRAEMQSPQFTRLLQSGVPVKTAYQVIHNDEIISGAMQFTAQKVQQATAASIASGQNRPTENGNASQGAAITTSDVSKLNKQQRQDYLRRAQAGEKITFR